MKNFQAHKLLSENILAKILLPANVIVSTVIFNWSEFFIYVSKINESGCKSFPLPSSFGSKISFGGYESHSILDFEFFLAIGSVILSIFYLPSYLITMIVVGAMKKDYPHWCIETFDIIFIPIFGVVNCVYLMFLGFLLRRIHDFYGQHKSHPESPLRIYPD